MDIIPMISPSNLLKLFFIISNTTLLNPDSNLSIGPYVLESIKKNKVALKGPVTTPVGKGFKSVNVRCPIKV
ncbi:MAG: hypothetical protein ACJAX4_003205 [Clostridium sp.]|jgi:hypothetical protein